MSEAAFVTTGLDAHRAFARQVDVGVEVAEGAASGGIGVRVVDRHHLEVLGEALVEGRAPVGPHPQRAKPGRRAAVPRGRLRRR
jgi:hypothetical protein